MIYCHVLCAISSSVRFLLNVDAFFCHQATSYKKKILRTDSASWHYVLHSKSMISMSQQNNNCKKEPKQIDFTISVFNHSQNTSIIESLRFVWIMQKPIRRRQTISTNIVQFNEEIIKDKLRNWPAAALRKHSTNCWRQRPRS